MRAVSRLVVAIPVIVVGLVLLVFESLWVVVGNHTLGTLGEVLLWVGFGLIVVGAALMVWAIASTTDAADLEPAGSPVADPAVAPPAAPVEPVAAPAAPVAASPAPPAAVAAPAPAPPPAADPAPAPPAADPLLAPPPTPPASAPVDRDPTASDG